MDLDDRMADPRRREQLLDLIRMVEQERTQRRTLAVARRVPEG